MQKVKQAIRKAWVATITAVIKAVSWLGGILAIIIIWLWNLFVQIADIVFTVCWTPISVLISLYLLLKHFNRYTWRKLKEEQGIIEGTDGVKEIEY